VVAKLLWDPHADVDAIINDYCKNAYGPGADAMKEYYRLAEDLSNRTAAAGKPNRDLDARLEKYKNKLTDPYTDEELAKFQACIDKATAAIGSSGASALQRVQLVQTGLEYTRKTRDLLSAAAAVRAGTGTEEDFNKIKTATYAYYDTLKGGLAVNVSHDIRSCLNLDPDRRK
jgi:hypothetical protein